MSPANRAGPFGGIAGSGFHQIPTNQSRSEDRLNDDPKSYLLLDLDRIDTAVLVVFCANSAISLDLLATTHRPVRLGLNDTGIAMESLACG